jgi:hypothetical protein
MFIGSLMSFPGPESATAFAVCSPWSQIALHRITPSDIDMICPCQANRLFPVGNIQVSAGLTWCDHCQSFPDIPLAILQEYSKQGTCHCLIFFRSDAVFTQEFHE